MGDNNIAGEPHNIYCGFATCFSWGTHQFQISAYRFPRNIVPLPPKRITRLVCNEMSMKKTKYCNQVKSSGKYQSKIPQLFPRPIV